MRTIAPLLALLCAGVSCTAPPPPAARRLAEQEPASATFTQKIDNTVQRVLDPSRSEHRFSLAGSPLPATLDFSVGVDAAAGDGRILFEIVQERPGGDTSVLYRKEPGMGTWHHDRIAVDGAAAGSTLVLRKSLLSGEQQTLAKGAWGNPMLLAGARARTAPNVILISLDTLRADRLGIYGRAATRSPSLDAFGSSGVVFERAYSPSTWTLPSHKSLLYGRFPISLDTEAAQPIASLLLQRGYVTAAFTGGGFMSPSFGFDRGFERYYAYASATGDGHCPPDRFDGAEVFRRAKNWLREPSGAPKFLFLHTYDVHDTCPFQLPGNNLLVRRPDPGPDGRARQLAYYDDLIAKLDKRFEDFMADLEQAGLAEDTIILVTSDHGEGFWEHGFEGHGKGRKMYDELTRVPLMVRWPRGLRGGSRVPQPVSLVSVPATILAMVDATGDGAMDAGPLPGLGLHPPGKDNLSAAVFRLVERGWIASGGALASWFFPPVYIHDNNMLAVRTARHKLIMSRINPDVTRVYDMTADPAESRNLAIREPALHAELSRLADAYWKSEIPEAAEAIVPDVEDEQTRERLRALGYVE